MITQDHQDNAEFVSRGEAANLLNLNVTSFWRHQQAGRISRIDSNPAKGSQAYYRRSDVLALVPYLQATQYEARRRRATRVCRICRQDLPVSEFRIYTRSIDPNKKQCQMHRCMRCSVTINNFHRCMKRVIAEGKTSPLCRLHGFSIAIDREGVYRAARMDKPLIPGESALVRYEYRCSVWCVLAVPVRVPDSERITEWCQRYEARLKARENKAKRTPTTAGRRA